MTSAEFDKIRKELVMKMRFMDTTIKGISESQEYKDNTTYNKGIIDSIDILRSHID